LLALPVFVLRLICVFNFCPRYSYPRSSSSQGARGPTHDQAPSSDADDSFSDSEADAELWAQFRESRQAPPALSAPAQHVSQAPHKAEKQSRSQDKARVVHGPPVVQARQGATRAVNNSAGGSALHVLEKVTIVVVLFLRCMVFVMNAQGLPCCSKQRLCVTSWCCIACCTIAQKLQEAVVALDHCDLHSGLHRAGELAEVICKLGAAIKTLRELDL
jgi:hypothetical protein